MRKSMNRLGSQAGFSLVQVTLALGVTALIALSSAQVITMASQSRSGLEAKLGQISLQKDISETLRKSASCMGALQTHTLNTSGNTPVSFRLDNGQVIGADPSLSQAKAYGVEIKRLDLVNPRVMGAINATDSIYSAELLMESRSMKGTQSEFAQTPIGQMRLQVSGGQITNCFTLEQTQDITQLTCDLLSGTMMSGVCRVMPDMTSIACPPGQYLQGFDTGGGRVCKPIPVVQATPTPTPTPTPQNCPSLSFTDPQQCHYAGHNGICFLNVPIPPSIVAPAGCRIDTITVNYRQFSAYAGSCAVAGSTTLYPNQIGIDRAPWNSKNKGYAWSGLWDPSTNSIAMNAQAYNWGPNGGNVCGGNACNGCISDLSFVVNTVPN